MCKKIIAGRVIKMSINQKQKLQRAETLMSCFNDESLCLFHSRRKFRKLPYFWFFAGAFVNYEALKKSE